MKGKRQFLSFSNKPSCRSPIAYSLILILTKIKGVEIMGKLTKPVVREIIEDFAEEISLRKTKGLPPKRQQ